MELKYAPAAGAAGGLRRRPGPDPAPWSGPCFGPWRLGGATWRPHVGGGFWCPAGAGTVALREARTEDFADIQTEDLVRSVAGEVAIRLGDVAGLGELRLGSRAGPDFHLRVASADARTVAVSVATRDCQAAQLALPRGDGAPVVRLRLAPATDGRIALAAAAGGAVDVRVPADGTQRLAVGSNPGGRVSFDLGGLRLETASQWPWHPED